VNADRHRVVGADRDPGIELGGGLDRLGVGAFAWEMEADRQAAGRGGGDGDEIAAGKAC